MNTVTLSLDLTDPGSLDQARRVIDLLASGVSKGDQLRAQIKVVKPVALHATSSECTPEPTEPEAPVNQDVSSSDTTPEVSVAAVETAIRAYAKSKGRDAAKAVMQKHGVEKLADISQCTSEQLQSLFTEVVS